MSAEPAFRGQEPEAISVRAEFDDEAGGLLFQEVAQGGGKPWVRRPDGRGGWIPNAEGVRRVLWNLPKLRAHLAEGRRAGPVYLTEGPSDARALEEHLAADELPGVVTTNPFGALSWEDDYSETQLRGAPEVIATVDNDAAGLKRAAMLERELGPHVDGLRILRTPLEHKGADLRDHLEAGLALDALIPVEPSEGKAEEKASAEPYAGLSHEEVLRLTFDGERHLIADLIEPSTVGVIAGVPETHKSHLAQEIAVSIALGPGREVLGRPVEVQGPTGYFWQDDSRRNEAERVQAYSAARDLPADLPVRVVPERGPRAAPRPRAAAGNGRGLRLRARGARLATTTSSPAASRSRTRTRPRW